MANELLAIIDTNQDIKSQILDRLSAACLELYDTEVGSQYYDNIKDFMESKGFWEAPASTRFHENFAGGLALHSARVANQAMMLVDGLPFSCVLNTSSDFAKIWICALMHDFCKLGYYESYSKNQKNSVTGAWETVKAYKVAEERRSYLGHGEDSAVIATRLIPVISDDMLLAIRWHMGLWDCSPAQQGTFGDACRKYPLVHLIQFADLLSTTEYAN